ncbi:MAG TPA: CRISPR-associated endoribonuclease Cas6 [Firmicutes bacterium]|nr:CRISPR-associated endoribonuclease Cas6 [Candidatus Fermentithermobacillaceae bacterium]
MVERGTCMHLTIHLRPYATPFAIPIHYNYYLQAAIYEGLSKEVGGFFHDTGFEYEGRKFKLFTFSRLLGKSTLDREKGEFSFSGDVTFIVSSPIKQFCSSLATGFLKLGSVRIASVPFSVTAVEVAEPQATGTSLLVRAMSPVTVYSTMTKYDGSKYTCYFDPREPEFQRLILSNLAKKYQVLTQEEPPQTPPFRIVPKGVPKLSIVDYKGTVVKGYSCLFLLEGPPQLLQIALDAGLGAKNSQGFGCIIPEQPVPAKTVHI